MNGYQVLIFKSPSDDHEDPYVAALEKEGIPTVFVPILQFQFKNFDLLQAALNKPENYSGLIFVSPRCVQSVIECLKNGTNIENWKDRECYVVGEATARTVDDNLKLPCSGSSSGNLAALLQSIDPSSIKKPLLMPCGNLNKDLPEEKKFCIEKVVVYETQEDSQLKTRLEDLLKDKEISFLAVFFSPSGVDFVVPYISNILDINIQFISLGPTTSKALKERNIKVSAICAKPNPECLVHEISKLVFKMK